MNFSIISPYSRLGKLVRLPLRLIPSNAVIPILQGPLRGYKWVRGSYVHGCWLGSYEYDKVRLVARMVKPGGIAFDLGANVGYYSLLFSRLVGPGGQVVAFEPFSPNVKHLTRHLQLNWVQNVKVIEAAVADTSGVVYFQKGKADSQGHIGASGELQVRQVSLDELVAQGEIPVPDYLKLDIEGAEYRALKGAESILTMHHPSIFLAIYGKDVHRQCCDLLIRLGYQLKPIIGQSVEQTDEILAKYAG